MGRSSTWNSPHSWASSMMDCRVTPGKIRPLSGGVTRTGSKTIVQLLCLIEENRSMTLTSTAIYVEHEYVHGAHFGELMVLSVKPQHLLTPFVRCLSLDSYRGAIVRTHLPVPTTPGPGSDVRRIRKERYWRAFPRAKVVAHGTKDCVEQCRFWLGHP